MGNGDGKCRLVRSGREPPVFRAEGIRGRLAGWSGEGKMLGKKRNQGNLKEGTEWLHPGRPRSHVTLNYWLGV